MYEGVHVYTFTLVENFGVFLAQTGNSDTISVHPFA